MDACWTCYEIYSQWNETEDGVYTIWLKDPSTGEVTNTSAFCDMSGGGYTVFQRCVHYIWSKKSGLWWWNSGVWSAKSEMDGHAIVLINQQNDT